MAFCETLTLAFCISIEFYWWYTLHFDICNKVITTMVITPLDDPTWCGCRFATPWFAVHGGSGLGSFDGPPKPLACNFKGGLFDPSRFGELGDRGCPHSIACPWAAFSSLLRNMVYLLTFLSHLAGSNSVSARPTRIQWQILLQKLLLPTGSR